MNEPFAFDPDTERVLRSAGWSETRSVPTAGWVGTLAREGLRVFPAAERLLANLGGLSVTPPPDEHRVFMPDPFTLDPVRAASGEADRIELWQEQFGLTLYPLGECFLHMILLTDPGGRIFAGTRGTFVLVGNSIEEAMAVLTLGRTRPTPFNG